MHLCLLPSLGALERDRSLSQYMSWSALARSRFSFPPLFGPHLDRKQCSVVHLSFRRELYSWKTSVLDIFVNPLCYLPSGLALAPSCSSCVELDTVTSSPLACLGAHTHSTLIVHGTSPNFWTHQGLLGSCLRPSSPVYRLELAGWMSTSQLLGFWRVISSHVGRRSWPCWTCVRYLVT